MQQGVTGAVKDLRPGDGSVATSETVTLLDQVPASGLAGRLEWLERLLLRLGTDAEIVRPVELKDRVRELAGRTLSEDLNSAVRVAPRRWITPQHTAQRFPVGPAAGSRPPISGFCEWSRTARRWRSSAALSAVAPATSPATREPCSPYRGRTRGAGRTAMPSDRGHRSDRPSPRRRSTGRHPAPNAAIRRRGLFRACPPDPAPLAPRRGRLGIRDREADTAPWHDPTPQSDVRHQQTT